MKLEQELDLWRNQCLETLIQVLKTDNKNALEEIKESYSIAIEQHTIEYITNRNKLAPIYYKIRDEINN